MSHANPRARRVAEQIRHELAGVLMREMKDPRITGVTLTAVEVSPDLEHAKVFYTQLTGVHPEVQKALQHAAGFLRTELSHRMRMRTVPQLVFQYDVSIERGAHLTHLIEQAVEEDRRHQHEDDQ